MGKKRRIINRSRKFAKKYFKILDGFDGNADDNEIEEFDAYIDTLTVTDNENQTVTIAGRLLGKQPTDPKVEYSVDGGTNFLSNGSTALDVGGSGIDKFTFNITDGSKSDLSALDVGTVDVIVRPKGITDPQRYKTVKGTAVRENKIVLALADNCFVDSTDNNIKFDASKCTVTSGKRQAGNDSNAVLGGGGVHAIGIRISVTQAGTTKSIVDKTGGNAAATQAIAKSQNFGNTSEDIPELLAVDSDAAGEPLNGKANGTTVEYVCTVVPVDAAGVALEASAVTQTVTVTKVA